MKKVFGYLFFILFLVIFYLYVYHNMLTEFGLVLANILITIIGISVLVFAWIKPKIVGKILLAFSVFTIVPTINACVTASSDITSYDLGLTVTIIVSGLFFAFTKDENNKQALKIK